MKKIYFLAASLLFASVANAQFEDDIESYNNGPLFTPRWTTWTADNDGNQNAIVSTDQAFDGTKSIFIGPSAGGQDAILDFGGLRTSGVWSVAWRMYIPSGQTAYFNLQGNVSPSADANQEFYSGNVTMTAGTLTDDGGGNTISYPENQWFDFSAEIDVDAGNYELKINGATSGVIDQGASATGLGGVDFFADLPTNTYFVDAVRFASGILSTDEFSADVFNVYPNPVVNTLNIKSENPVQTVAIYDILGKQVLIAQPDAISPSVDMSRLPSGVYLVSITINGASKTIKVLK